MVDLFEGRLGFGIKCSHDGLEKGDVASTLRSIIDKHTIVGEERIPEDIRIVTFPRGEDGSVNQFLIPGDMESLERLLPTITDWVCVVFYKNPSIGYYIIRDLNICGVSYSQVEHYQT